MEAGEPDRVLEMRRGFQRLMRERYTEMIEQLTGANLDGIAASWRDPLGSAGSLDQ